MKLLIIAPEQIPVPPPVGGSVEHCIYQIAKNFSSNHQITIVSLKRKQMARKSVIGNITILRVDGGSKQTYLQNALQRVKNNDYDLIQIDNRPSFVNRVKKVFPSTPVSVFMHSMTFVSPPMTTSKKAEADLKRASLIIGNSKSLMKMLGRTFPAYKNKMKYVYLGVDHNQYFPNAKGEPKSFHVLFAGRMIPRKGIPALMQAVKIARNSVPIRLSIAGGSGTVSYKAYLKRTANSLGIPVAFKGYLTRGQMPGFYRTGSCFVCPSQQHEAFGLVNIEAMASGLPVVASRIGGIPEIVKDGRNGLLVSDYRSPQAFAKQILKLASQPIFRRKLATQARRDAIRQFSWRQTARKLTSIYELYLNKK
ncbi:glycosyltransferase family 4 protein [Paenibacillus sp. MMO-58]|uniref:glycosyltransferase family 4 protein n=1 Tax=Paenibacillus sp. MMO-58 TaxID=3081290 RepID=UPI00301824AB